jgi:hypothetical protein
MSNSQFYKNSYFYDANMRKDKLVSLGATCLEQLAVIILKNTAKYPINYYALLLDDITFLINLDNNNKLLRSAIKVNSSGINKELLSLSREVIEHDGTKALDMIESALHKEGHVILRTADAFLPFSIYYNPEEFDRKLFRENAHVIMIVGSDDENLFFVDQLNELNLNKYSYYKDRKDIGVYKKKDFYEALNIYAAVMTMQFNEHNVKEADKFSDKILMQAINHYYNNVASMKYDSDEVKAIGGREALLFLKELCINQSGILNEKVCYPFSGVESKFDMYKEIINGITGIVNRREILLGFYNNKKVISMSERILLKHMREDITAWEILKSAILKKYEYKDYLMGQNELPYIEQVIYNEELIFEKLQKVLI